MQQPSASPISSSDGGRAETAPACTTLRDRVPPLALLVGGSRSSGAPCAGGRKTEMLMRGAAASSAIRAAICLVV